MLIGGPGHDPVYRYGFWGTALACQGLYWTIGGDPVRHRPLMPVAALAKLGFAVPVAILYARGAADASTLAFGAVDLAIAAGFMLARRATPDWKPVAGASI